MNPALAQQDAPRWVTEGPVIERSDFAIELPVTVLGRKLYVEVTLGGEPRRFVFDTGSPSMISRALAAELGLQAVDTVRGTDAHGAVVSSDIVQADLALDGTTLRRVPLFAADFSAVKPAQCLLGDGVLGSEILPLCAWQFDLPGSVIRCNASLDSLDHVAGAARLPLYDFGYPHAPYLDVRFARDAVSKAMFDTGSADLFTISPPDFDGADRARATGRTVEGYGSRGTSLGGKAPDEEQRRVELRSLAVGHVDIGRVDAVVRESPPSLIGASLLEHFVVTLDARSGSAYLDRYRDGPPAREDFGFSLAFDDTVSIALVWEGSPAAAALRAGQRVVAINGQLADTSCDGIERARRALEGNMIEIELQDGKVTLERGHY